MFLTAWQRSVEQLFDEAGWHLWWNAEAELAVSSMSRIKSCLFTKVTSVLIESFYLSVYVCTFILCVLYIFLQGFGGKSYRKNWEWLLRLMQYVDSSVSNQVYVANDGKGKRLQISFRFFFVLIGFLQGVTEKQDQPCTWTGFLSPAEARRIVSSFCCGSFRRCVLCYDCENTNRTGGNWTNSMWEHS